MPDDSLFMKITRFAGLFIAAVFCTGVAARGQDSAAAAASPALVMTLMVPHGEYVSTSYDHVPGVPVEDHGGARMLHVQVVIHNLTDKELYLGDAPDECGPFVEVKSGDGKSWVPFYDAAARRAGVCKALRTVPPKGRTVFDVYFNNYAPGAPARKFTGKVTLRAVLTGPAAKSAAWEGSAISTPVECMVQ